MNSPARPSLVAFALVTALGLAASTARADATSSSAPAAPSRPNGCAVSVPSQAIANMRVPANVLAIPGRDDSYNATPKVTVDAEDSVTFVVEPDVFSTGGLLVRPSGDLPLGARRITHTTECSVATPGEPRARFGEGSITVTEAAVFPKSIGTIAPGSVPGRIRIALSKELLPYRSVAEIAIVATTGFTNGGKFLGGSYGNISAPNELIEVGYTERTKSAAPAESGVYFALRPMMDAFSGKQCEGKSGVVSIPIEVKLHIAGASADADPAPLKGAVSVDCDAAESEYKAASTPVTTPGSSESLGNDSGGCRVATQGSDASSRTPLVSFMVVLGAVIAATRRRS